MHRIDGSSNINNRFTDGDPTTDQRATVVTADWLNDVQENIAAVLVAAKVSLTKGRSHDLLDAILRLIPAVDLEGYLTQSVADGRYARLPIDLTAYLRAAIADGRYIRKDINDTGKSLSLDNVTCSGRARIGSSANSVRPRWTDNIARIPPSESTIITASSDGFIGVLHVHANSTNSNNELISASSNYGSSGRIQFAVENNGDYGFRGSSTALSDRIEKEQIADAREQSADIRLLRFRNFKMKDDVLAEGNNARERMGLIAQEVAAISPKLIKDAPDGRKHIKLDALLMKFGKALQESIDETDKLKAQNKKLEQRIAALETSANQP